MDLRQISMQTAVKLGGLHLSPKSVPKALRRYCKQLLASNDFDEYPYTLRGSGAAVRMNGASFIFCCHHQISDYAVDRILVIPTVSTNLTINCSAAYKPTAIGEDADIDVNDLRALEFVPENYSIPNLGSEFLDVEKGSLFPGNVQAAGIFYVVGYPSHRQKINSDELPRIQANQIFAQARYEGASKSPHVHRLVLTADVPVAMDGMSGGPVFYLGGKPGGYFVGFAGIIVRGSATSNIIHFIDSTYLWDVAMSAKSAPATID